MIAPFTYVANPGRVIFGSGTIAQLPDEAGRLGLKRLLILSTAEQQEAAELAERHLGPLAAGRFAGAVMHTPTDVTEAALTAVRDRNADGVVAIGGGSTIGLGKAIAVRTDLPQIVLPTTYAGSEMTPILGETENGRKTTRSDPAILPETVLYDVDLSMTLPAASSGTSGLNAIAHAVEALYARERNPITSLMALEGVAALARSIPRIVAEPGNREARTDALYGAWLCGSCLGMVGMALHHKLCHVLGGTFNLPHAETHSIVLPHALAYNAPVLPDVMDSLAAVLGADPARVLQRLASTAGAPGGLRDLGMPEEGIEVAADLALANPYWNPRALEREPLRALIARAWSGDRPAT